MSQTDLQERVSKALREAKKPVAFKVLAKLLKANDAELGLALESAQAHRWPGRSQPFWHISPQEKSRQAILEVAEAQAFSKADLSKQAAKNSFGMKAKQMGAYIAVLIAEKELLAVPAFSGTTKLLVRPGGQQAYFKAARLFIEQKILKAEFDPAGFFKEASQSEKTNTAAQIVEAVQLLEPVRGVPVSTLRLRSHLQNLTKADFDQAALELRKQQQVILSQHADPHNLSQEEKDNLIEGYDGTYYVAIAIR